MLLDASDDELDSSEDSLGTATLHVPRRSWRVSQQEAIAPAAHQFRDVPRKDMWTRTCHHSAWTGDGLCVHTPFCVRRDAIVYLSDQVQCGAYSNQQGLLGVLSAGRCAELQRQVENAGDIESVEHRAASWLDGLEKEGKVLWFEGDTIFLRLSARCTAVSRFAERIFLLHHILQHPERYGLGAVSNVVIASHEDVARKIRYSKSWHHGLLTAVVYPAKPEYSLKALREQAPIKPGSPSEVRVFAPNGLWAVSRGKAVPCFRRAAVAGSVSGALLLAAERFPGVVGADAAGQEGRFRDADVFRGLLFRSVGRSGPPGVARRLVYLHRSGTRMLSEDGLAVLEGKLREVAAGNGFEYRFVDVKGMNFAQQVDAVAGAGVVVGVHGTQMMNVLFLGKGAGVVEIFPYRFVNSVYEGGSGAGLHYTRHSVVHGEEFGELEKFNGIDNCLRVSRECRLWYQCDRRSIEFGLLDAAAVASFVQESIVHVEQTL